jgi:hypothetical protein
MRPFKASRCSLVIAPYVESVGRLLVLRLLKLPAVDQLDVGDRDPGRLARLLTF